VVVDPSRREVRLVSLTTPRYRPGMSYDLLAFDPAVVDDVGFDAWWKLQQWRDDDATASPLVDGFVRDLQGTFPSMEAPEVVHIEERSEDPELFDHASSYSFGDAFVYVCFNWSVADEARTAFLHIAQQWGVAVALISDGTTILRPLLPEDPRDGDRSEQLVEDFVEKRFRSEARSARAVEAVLLQRLRQLNGDDFGVYILQIEPAAPGGRRGSASGAGEFIQSAGSSSGMTVEIKRREADGQLLQYAVGRPDDDSGERIVLWADGRNSERVPANEVFTADQAHPVYRQWCLDRTIPPGHRLRLLHI
jgi:hypothetical protein